MSQIKFVAAANRLLSSLPHKDQLRFMANCDQVDLVFSDVLAEPGERIRYVYFPTQSFISLTTKLEGHSTLEVGMIGAEGMLGASLILGVDVWPLHALVQGAGPALRMEVALFCAELERNPGLQETLKRYLYVLMVQLTQTAACTRFHMVEARLARWLLMTMDRAHTEAFHVTQEFLAYMLGVRRVGITKAATALQNSHLIRYRRGNISVLDRAGLEAASCNCYATDSATYIRVMAKHDSPTEIPPLPKVRQI